MKILNIPAYSYFANIPCYHEIDVACDTALINALFDTYGTTRTRVINISQDNINLRKVINNFFNVEVLPYKHPLTNFVFNDTCN